jgi:Vacuolar-sorting-associated 13 protein C-terminal
MAEVQSHYTQQAVKQLYVLVLGLDVIGNPFGLVLGLTQGVGDLFYEPFQVNLSSPENLSVSDASVFRVLFKGLESLPRDCGTECAVF